MKIKKGSLLKTISVLLFIICSGSQFGIDNARYMDIAFFVVSALNYGANKNRSIKRKQAFSFALIMLFLWGNFILFLPYSPNVGAYISYTFRILGALLLAASFTYDEFKDYFIKIIVIIAGISIIAYVQRFFSPGDRGYSTSFIFFRISRVNKTIRNSGIFWEPGAYQIFLNLALFFMLQTRKSFVTKRKQKIEVIAGGFLVLAIISTMSTTGYLMLIINAVVLYINNYQMMRRRYRVLLAIPMLILFGVIIYQMVISDTVFGKFYGGGNVASTAIRMRDFNGTIEIIKKHPFGMGHGTTLYYDTLVQYLIGNNSSGLLSATCQVGIHFALYYMIKIVKFSKKEVKNRWFFFLAIVLISGFTENFFYYPIYFVMLFGFLKTREREKRNDANV